MRPALVAKLSVWGRVFTAAPLGYAAASLVVMALARILPGDRAEVTVIATLLSFAIYAALVIYIFAAATARRAFLVTLLVGAAAGGIAWVSIATGGRL